MAFATVAFAELALVFSLRSPVRPRHAPRNPYLVGSVVLSAAIVIAALYLPVLNEPLGTVRLGPTELAVVAALALAPFACAEVGKAVLRRRLVSCPRRQAERRPQSTR